MKINVSSFFRNGIFLFFSITVVALLYLFLSSSKSVGSTDDERSYASSVTVSAFVPEYVEFCGEKISLERLDMRERYDREINAFTYLHSTTLLYLKRANRFFPIIEPILKKNGIPDDFKYLCVIESGLDTRALSPAKAAGLWQFIESTGKSYGLEIRDGVDERYHIEKATEAACRYLKDAYDQYGDWVNVAASYNAGMGRITSQLEKQYVDSAFDLHLVSETSRYVFRIMAAKQLFMNPRKYGFVLKKENFYPMVNTDCLEVSSDIPDLADFAKKQGINYMTLKEYNVWLRDTKLIMPKNNTKSYWIAIPKKGELQFNKNKIKVHDKRWITD